MQPSENANRNLTMKHLASGGHGVFDGEGNQIGLIEHKHLVKHVNELRMASDRLSSVIPGSPSIDREVQRRTRQIMQESGLDAREALKSVLRQDPALAARYREAHTRCID